MDINRLNKVLSVIALLLMFSSAYGQAVVHKQDDNTGAKSWQVKQYGVSFYLNQLLPDQIRAFYSNRGFSLPQIEAYANSCVYMAVLKNEDAASRIDYVLADWVIHSKQGDSHLKAVDWLSEFKQVGATSAAMIAFKWAQLPAQQSYEPGGDWNQGMLSLGAKKGSFDVTAKWTMNDKIFATTLSGVSCAL